MVASSVRRGAGIPALILTLFVACEDAKVAPSTPSDVPSQPNDQKPGASPHPIPDDPHEFISAEGQAGQALQASRDAGSAGAASTPDSDGAESESRTVEEGDIYRVLGPGQLLNLNPYRGLQVVDLSNLAEPKVIGRLREAGSPVEMYMVGTRAIVLLNNWTGYWGSRTDVHVEQKSGGLILSVDLSNPAAPAVTDREFVSGSILTSRLTRQGERAALYVAASDYDCNYAEENPESCPRTVVKSIDASTPDLIARTTLDLGGYVSALQATPEALIVARTNYNSASSPTSVVSLIDITDIDGNMVEGAQTAVRGQIRSKFNLDLRGNVLRVVSGASWWGDANGQNHLETFDASDKARLTPIAHCAFGDGMSLFATLFMADRAFFVTYLRIDPFHAFAIDAAGQCEERSEFVVSGWNDFFKPVFEDRRLIGIGKNDEQSQTVAVSLYDVTNLDNPTPLIARMEVSAQQSWSEANWDDKAFSVIEDAVSVTADGDPGVAETGLVLLPFVSYGQNGQEARAGVQIYTFSERTLSRRGFMNHGQPVTRSFQPEPALTANLSAEELSLFDTQDPAAPLEKGRVELAPNYSDVLDYDSFLVRVHDTRGAYYGWWSEQAEPPPAYAEIIPKADDPDAAEPFARITIPAGSRAFRVGMLLVVISTQTSWENGYADAKHHSSVYVYDLSTPSTPTLLSSLQSDRLLPAYGYGWGWGYYGGCGVIDGGYYDDFSRVLPNALVLGRNLPQQESIGVYESCSTWLQQPQCVYASSGDCEWHDGSSYCERKLDSDREVCTNSYAHCVRKDGMTTCSPLSEAPPGTQRRCYTSEHYRYWQSMELDVLDLRDPRAATLTPVSFAREEEATGLVASGQSVYFAFKVPHAVPGDDRPFAKYYFREVGLQDPSRPAVGAPVNVPGQLLAVDGARLFTRDLRWGDEVAETWLHVLGRSGDVAELAASHAFSDREVTGVLVDGATRVFVTHRELWKSRYYYDPRAEQSLDKLTVFSADALGKQGETDVDAWSDMTQAVGGRILFSVPGGLMIVNAQDPSQPYAQAYFPQSGWLRNVSYDGQSILVAAGPYGVYRMDATTHNLLAR